ncbi:hypothetical protein RND71_001411 [Anisodus tanguticus]|uniref:MADS-box domain-containing protein n=1 Tax=Anisodus tanguticus TaxID=243964 RepID=A0AAE1T0V3_9SOLA|nr:hypothetical protein RND71_001411 [Anisodus tanguticus]
MTRTKVKLALIKNITQRKASYKKRQNGYMKKAQELSTLCDVETATVIYSPYHDEPKVFPNYDAAVNTFTKFRELPELEKSKNMATLKDFTQKRIKKLEDQLEKVRKENRMKEFTNMMYEVLNGKDIPVDIESYDLNDLSYVINQHLKRTCEAMKAKTDGEGTTSNAPQPIVELMVPGGTISIGPNAPLLDPSVASLTMDPWVVPGETNFKGPGASLLAPDVAPISVIPPVALSIVPQTDASVVPLFASTQVSQLMFQPVASLTAPPQTVGLVGPSRVPPSPPMFSSQMFPQMVSQFYPQISQQMAPPMPTPTMDSPMPSPMMVAPLFPPTTPPMDPSTSIPPMGASTPMNNYQSNSYGFPQSLEFTEMMNWNDEIMTLLDDLSFNDINVEDPNHNNNNF